MTIFHRNEKRDLAAAVRFYLDREHKGAHTALADASATADILMAQIDRYGLAADVQGLHEYCHEKPADYVDADGKLRWRNGEAVFVFGRYKGESLREVAGDYHGRCWLRWAMGQDFRDDFKNICRDAENGIFPQREIARGE